MSLPTEAVEAVAGFGFLPRWYAQQLRDFSRQMGIDERWPGLTDANDTLARNSAKCGVVRQLFEAGVVPNGDELDPGGGEICSPLFDGASCFPATSAGEVRVIPCMDSYGGVQYNTTGEFFTANDDDDDEKSIFVHSRYFGDRENCAK